MTNRACRTAFEEGSPTAANASSSSPASPSARQGGTNNIRISFVEHRARHMS